MKWPLINVSTILRLQSKHQTINNLIEIEWMWGFYYATHCLAVMMSIKMLLSLMLMKLMIEESDPEVIDEME